MWQAGKPASRHVARGTTARMRHDSEATWQGCGWPTQGARRGHVAKGHTTTQVHVGARVGRHVEGGFAYGGPTGIVGPGKNLGAVTQMCYRAPIFIHDKFHYFLRYLSLPLQVTWTHGVRWI